MATVTLVGSSHIRRLRDAIQTKSGQVFPEDFGTSQAKLSFVCKGGWTICDVHNETKRVAETHPDYLIRIVASSDLVQGERMNSIKVANSIIQLVHHLCLTSGAKGAIICSLMQCKGGRYLSTPCEVDRYSERVVLANDFFHGSRSLRRRSVFPETKRATWAHWSFCCAEAAPISTQMVNIGHTSPLFTRSHLNYSGQNPPGHV